MSFQWPNFNQLAVIEQVNRSVREQGDIKTLMQLDQITEVGTEVEKTAILGQVIKNLQNYSER